MRKVFLLAALCMVGALMFAPAASAQSATAASSCDVVQERLNAGDDSLTSDELLDCGLSPEAIDPCEGNPDPAACRAETGTTAEDFPSINAPDATASASADPCPDPDFPRQTPDGCQASDLPDVIGGGTPVSSAGADEDTVTATAEAEDEESASASASADEIEALPATGGPSVAPMLAPAALLLVGGLVALRVVRRV